MNVSAVCTHTSLRKHGPSGLLLLQRDPGPSSWTHGRLHCLWLLSIILNYNWHVWSIPQGYRKDSFTLIDFECKREIDYIVSDHCCNWRVSSVQQGQRCIHTERKDTGRLLDPPPAVYSFICQGKHWSVCTRRGCTILDLFLFLVARL